MTGPVATPPGEDGTGAANAIVFSGGGIFFATHVGVMNAMSGWTMLGRPWLDSFQVLVGTSAGALYAALYASGLTPGQIALYARMFADPAIGPQLFDANLAGLGAAFIRHDPAYALGAVRGLAIQTLLETVLSREVHARLSAVDPTTLDERGRQELRDYLVKSWKQRRARARDAAYYKDQLTFGDCRKALFIISVNAYSGQKTVFKLRPDQANWPAEQREDDAMYSASAPRYLNAPQPGELAAAGADPTLEFRRFENRVYRAYDAELYGPQLPLAMAVRASLSIPVIFEPLRVQRWRRPGAPTEEDLFIDGGVDDNFSLSVAVDPFLGNSSHVLGIALGNLGYRIPDAAATDSIVALLNRTTGYMGDAVMDVGGTTRELAGHRVTVMDALAGVRGQLTDTNLIGKLVDEGTTIAADFWSVLHGGRAYPGPGAPVDPAAAFAYDPEAVFLSAAARGVQPPQKPKALDTQLSLAEVFRVPLFSAALEWRVVYALIAFVSLGVATALFVIISAIGEALGGHPGSAVAGLLASVLVGLLSITAGILVVRLIAFALWRAGLARASTAQSEPRAMPSRTP